LKVPDFLLLSRALKLMQRVDWLKSFLLVDGVAWENSSSTSSKSNETEQYFAITVD